MQGMEAVLDAAAVVEVRPGVIAEMWAEGDEGGGLDADLGDGGDGGEFEDLGEAGDAGTGEIDPLTGQPKVEEKVDGRKGSKEFRDAVKAWEATPEGAKFAKEVRANHFKMQQLAEIAPGGINEIRERYALLESIGGTEALTQMQERVAEVDATDAALAAGDPKALEALGPDFDPGLAKLTPQILDRVMRSNPEAYSAAILPHLMSALGGSPMVGDLNKMIDVFGAAHLDDAGKLNAIKGLLGRIGQWFDHNEKKAGELKTAPVDKGRQELDTERTEFEKQQQNAHWDNKIIPGVAAAEQTKFDELLKPYIAQLKLTPAQKDSALKDFRSKLTAACLADKGYTKQRDLYRKQKNPDPAVVTNFAKTHLNTKAKAAFDQVKAERWGGFLRGGKKAAAAAVPGARTAATVGTQPVVVSVRPDPSTVDYQKTTEKDQYAGIYTLKSGKRVKWVKSAV